MPGLEGGPAFLFLVFFVFVVHFVGRQVQICIVFRVFGDVVFHVVGIGFHGGHHDRGRLVSGDPGGTFGTVGAAKFDFCTDQPGRNGFEGGSAVGAAYDFRWHIS